MEVGALTGYIDAAQVVLYVFWVFFFGLVFYLHQEGKREGYPLVDDVPRPEGRIPIKNTAPLMVTPKSFKLREGETMELLTAPPDERPIKAERFAKHPGAAMVPTGNVMGDCIGPGSWAERKDIPDAAVDGTPKLAPMRVATDFHVIHGDPDPRGMRVVGADGEVGGTVTDIWVDKGEFMIRYLELDANGNGQKLLPITRAIVDGGKKQVRVVSILGDQFANIPETKNPDVVTRLEEDQICAYYGAGQLYATKSRSEPLI